MQLSELPSGQLLGFAARVPAEEVAAHWDYERRSGYLIRKDVECPLSTDVIVWPSSFGPQYNPTYQTHYDQVQDLAISLEDLHQSLRQEDIDIAATTVVAVEILLNRPVGDLYPAVRPIDPPSVDRIWRLIGYDVSDESLLSGLMNTKYSDSTLNSERESRWAQNLNIHHLFHDPAQALEFAKFSDERVPEHAPFFVFGLWCAGSQS
jgi:hypothetical protein